MNANIFKPVVHKDVKDNGLRVGGDENVEGMSVTVYHVQTPKDENV